MADHVLEIEFKGDWSTLRSETEREAAAARAKFAGVGVGGGGGGGGNAAAVGVPGAQPAVQQAVADAFGRVDARRNAVQAAGGGGDYWSGAAILARHGNIPLDPTIPARPITAAQRAETAAYLRAQGFRGGGGGVGGGIAPPAMPGDGLPAQAQGAGGGGAGEGGGGGRGNFFGLGYGGLARLATVGWIGREAFSLAQSQAQYNRDQLFAGNDQAAQLRAQLSQYDRLTNIPFAGQAIGFINDPMGEQRTQIELTMRGAGLTDERTRMIRDDRVRLDRAERASAIAGAPNQYARERLTAAADRAKAQTDIEDSYAARGALNQTQIAQRVAEHDADFRNQVGRRLARGGYGQNYYTFFANQVRQENEADVANLRTTLGTQSTRTRDEEAAAADRLERNRLNTVNRNETAYGIRSAASIRANLAASRNDRFGATIESITGEQNAGVAGAGSPEDALRAFREGQSKLTAYFGETNRETNEAIEEARARVAQNRALLTGNNLGAQRIGIEARRDAALRALPNNFLYNNFFGGNDRRQGIRDEAQSDIDLASYQDQRQQEAATGGLLNQSRVSALIADRKPIEARAYDLVSSARLQARLETNVIRRGAILANAMNQAKALENEIMYGGAAEAVAVGTTGGRAARNEQASYHPEENQDVVEKAIRDLQADFNNSMIGPWRAGSPY